MGIEAAYPALDFIGDVYGIRASGEHMREQMRYGEREAVKAREWQEMMSSTAYQRATQDLIKAGLNPMLAYEKGGASTPGGAMPGGASPGGIPSRHSITAGMQSAAMIKRMDAEIENINADTELKRTQAGETVERTPTHRANIELTKTKTDETIANIRKLLQEEKTGAASAAEIEQRTINLRESVPQIRAMTEQLRTLSSLQQWQVHQVAAQAKLSEAQASEIIQRVKQNLPQIERAIRELEEQARKLEMPRRGMEAAANDSFLGALGAVLRTIVPLSPLLGAVR